VTGSRSSWVCQENCSCCGGPGGGFGGKNQQDCPDLLSLTEPGSTAVPAGLAAHPGESVAAAEAGQTSGPLRRGAAAGSDPHGGRASPRAAAGVRRDAAHLCAEVRAAATALRGLALASVCTSLCSVFLRVGRLGILIVRHLKRLERVILGYLEVCDGPEEEARLGILETLQCTIEHAWPRYQPGGERGCRKPTLNAVPL